MHRYFYAYCRGNTEGEIINFLKIEIYPKSFPSDIFQVHKNYQKKLEWLSSCIKDLWCARAYSLDYHKIQTFSHKLFVLQVMFLKLHKS